MTTDAMIQVPYPSDTRSKGWRFELDLEQIMQSDTWALAAEIPMAQQALLMMWTVAWMQVPCGSMPADSNIVRAKLNVPRELWEPMREIVMRGWWQAEDGRLYHPTITTRVLSMIGHKEAERVRKADYRTRMDAERHEKRSRVSPNMSHGTNTGQTTYSGGKDDTGTGTGTGTYKNHALQAATVNLGAVPAAAAPANPVLPVTDPPEPPPDDPVDIRALELVVLLRSRGASITAGNVHARRWARSGVSDAQVLAALESAEKRRADAQSPQPVNAGLLNAIIADAQRAPPRRASIHDERAATIAALTGRRPNHEHESGTVIDITPAPTGSLD